MSETIVEDGKSLAPYYELGTIRADISEIKKDLRDIEKAHYEATHIQETKMQELAFKDALMDRKQDAILKSQSEMWSSIGEIKTIISNQVTASIKAQGEFAKTLTKLTMTTLGYGIVGAGLLAFSIWSFLEWNKKLDTSELTKIVTHKESIKEFDNLKEEVFKIKLDLNEIRKEEGYSYIFKLKKDSRDV